MPWTARLVWIWTVAQGRVGKGMLGSQGQRLGQSRFGRREQRRPIIGRIKRRLLHIDIRPPHQRLDIAGIER